MGRIPTRNLLLLLLVQYDSGRIREEEEEDVVVVDDDDPGPPLSRPSGANGKDPSTSKHTHGIRTDVIVFVEVVALDDSRRWRGDIYYFFCPLPSYSKLIQR